MFRQALAALAFSISVCANAAAHEIWIDRGGQGAARIYYGEPGEGEIENGAALDDLASPIVFQSDRARRLAVTRQIDHLSVASSGSGDVRMIQTGHAPWQDDETGAFEHAVFYARHGLSDPSTALDLEIAPVASAANTFALTYKGAPVAGAEISALAPGGGETKLTSDAQGRFLYEGDAAGRHLIAAMHEDTAPRIVQNQAIAKTYHVTTLTFVR